ncbi:hypothetical protein ABZZ17_03875 [Streptomyces sp. NPDC006512]|uniref:hypothetical protein n=1 Tax=Streptomyces sp. NPDC006512 TaxID=3154307 RepID=UPI0033A4B322
MDDQGGAGGVPPHDGHHSHGTPRGRRRDEERPDGRTPAADTDEASRLDRPSPTADAGSGRKRWVGPQDEKGTPDTKGK